MATENKQDRLIDPAVEVRIDELLGKMTLEEKAGQLNVVTASMVGGFDFTAFFDNPDPDAFKDVPRDYHPDWIRAGLAGTYSGPMNAALINDLQRVAVEESRLGIPILFGLDVIHGLRTIFPIPLAESCSWEPELARRNAEIAAREASAAGIHWTFAPMMDIARDPRWGRIAEGAGEDPYLGSQMAAARVAGFQGDDLADPEHVIACAKHYVAYGAAVGGRDYNTVEVALQTLHEFYLPPFAAAVRAGAATVMSAFNDINGVPASANRYTLTEVLRGMYGFNGLVTSDAFSVGELIPHGYAKDRRDAGQKALLAGVDIDMSADIYRDELPALVRAGLLPLEALDEAVRRVLRIKLLMGLFEHPYRTDAARETASLLHPDHISAARDAARRSIVLLKNENRALPLRKDLQVLAVIGPLADNAPEMLGSWSFTGSPKDVVPVLAGIRGAVGAKTEVLTAPGCKVDGGSTEEFSTSLSAALEIASQAGAIIAVVGEKASMSGEAASRQGLGLPGRQEELLRALRQTGKPLIVVLINGRPLAIPWLAQNAAAILEAWQPGIQAGPAIADVLFGDYNPSGKLTTTFPYAVGQVPLYYNHPNTGRPEGEFKFTSKYIDGPTGPLYPFGYGLSYTTFAYSDLTISPQKAASHGRLRVSALLANTGDRPGEEIAQLYIADLVASRVRPVKELKGFQKVALQPGESRVIRFDLEVANLGFYNQKMEYVVEPGDFKVWVGPNSQEGLEGAFEVY